MEKLNHDNMEQTAVEWLKKRIRAELTYEQDVLFEELFEQALAMEKEQIKDAWLNSLTKGDFNSAEEYYKETYESQ
jgi:hypothetical protein